MERCKDCEERRIWIATYQPNAPAGFYSPNCPRHTLYERTSDPNPQPTSIQTQKENN
jgi:hypothetical protein